MREHLQFLKMEGNAVAPVFTKNSNKWGNAQYLTKSIRITTTYTTTNTTITISLPSKEFHLLHCLRNKYQHSIKYVIDKYTDK